MTIKEKIAVMQAYAEGKEIEMCSTDANSVKKWVKDCCPIWNWQYYDYRVKPAISLRPYIFEELKAEMAKGKIAVKELGYRRIFTILQVKYDVDKKCEIIQLTNFNGITYEQLLKNYVWLDDSPCGVLC